MYSKYNETVDDDIVLNLEGWKKKSKIVFKKKSWILCILFFVCATSIFGLEKLFIKDSYEASITYLVTMTGDSQADAYAATMLGSQMDAVYESSGLKNMIEKSLKKEMKNIDWMEQTYLSNSFDASTNMFTMEIHTPKPKYTQALLNTVEKVLPVYASNQLGYVVLTKIDTYINLEKPVVPLGTFLEISIALGIALLLSLLFFVIEVYRNTLIYGKEDMKTITSLACMGELEKVEHKKEPVSFETHTKRIEHYREGILKLRQKVERAMQENGDKVLMIASSVSEEGKTTISCNLAMALAQTKKKVLLMDMDIYRAGVREQLNPKEIHKTLPDYLKGEASLEDIITKGLPMDVIYGDAKQKINGVLLGEERMKSLLQTLREEYDYILVDTAPTLWRSDADLFTKEADALLYVVQYAHANKDTIYKGLQTIRDEHIHQIGYVLNGVDYSTLKYADYYK